VPSSSASAGALAEAYTGWHVLTNLADDAAGTGLDICSDARGTSHDKPSRSVNSVFTPTNERRSSAHCAGVVTSAAWSSRRSAASFARRRAARASARGVVMSCWMGRDWHVGVDAELGMHPGVCVRGGLGVARADAEVDADIISADIASVDGAKDARVILLDLNVMMKRRGG